MQYFKTAQLYFKSTIDQFDILAVSEHSLFEEQLRILKTATDSSYNCHAVSARDNPRIISGEQAHGGVALFWKYSFNDFATPIKATITRCDLSPRFFCNDATLLCEFESDKI